MKAGRGGGSPDRDAAVVRWLFVFSLFVYVLSGGGRVVGSDEVTMLEVARSMLHGHVDVPPGATLAGSDGRHYSKNAAGQAILALPLVAVAEAAAGVAGLDPSHRSLAVRFVVSFFNALVTALLIVVFHRAARRLQVTSGAAATAALMLGFATPLWVYSKSFMAEPLQGLGLLLALDGAAHAGTGRLRIPPPLVAGVGACLAISVKLSMLPLALACLLPMVAAPPRTWIAPALGVALAFAGHAVYSLARFGTPFETGYGAQATAAAYTTPLLVGLYGLLISSGKGVLWFAPGLWLIRAGGRAIRDDGARAGSDWRARFGLATPAGRVACGAAAAWIAALLLYARFQHWAGDGSFGPRYLVPVLPIAFLVVSAALGTSRSPVRSGIRRFAIVLAVLGTIVQIGGVAIYFGAQMRESGDYPYRMALEDPRSMSDSHFNPRFSPIAGHWSMLHRNLREHLRGGAPRLDPFGAVASDEAVDPRTGLTAADQHALLHGFDLWWAYLGYAGYGGRGLPLAPLLLVALAVAASLRLRRAVRRADVEPAAS